MDAFDFITAGDAEMILDVLGRAKCSECGGSGERSNAEAGDTSHNNWACSPCDGNGWNKQAVREIIAAVEQ